MDYFKIPAHVNARFVPDGCGSAELVALVRLLPFSLSLSVSKKIQIEFFSGWFLAKQCSDFLVPPVLNANQDGQSAYATSDLFAPHPTRPDYWRVIGRADDQIMHSNGEKVRLSFCFAFAFCLCGSDFSFENEKKKDESWSTRSVHCI